MEVLYKSARAIAVYKPVGVPSQSDPSGDRDIMTLCSEYLSELGEDSRLWLVHRLDRGVGGVIVLARSAAAAAELSDLLSGAESAKKKYLAVISGEIEDGVMEDLIFKDKLKSKSYIVDRERRGVKKCRLEAKTLATRQTERGVLSLLSVSLYTGRFHQIRAQLSHRAHPIVGDKKYGSRDVLAKSPALFAYKLDLKMKKEGISVKRLPELGEYPWSIFADVIGEL
jgi:23S rRNA pseudouridine1911/1915/1917 synthase